MGKGEEKKKGKAYVITSDLHYHLRREGKCDHLGAPGGDDYHHLLYQSEKRKGRKGGGEASTLSNTFEHLVKKKGTDRSIPRKGQQTIAFPYCLYGVAADRGEREGRGRNWSRRACLVRVRRLFRIRKEGGKKKVGGGSRGKVAIRHLIFSHRGGGGGKKREKRGRFRRYSRMPTSPL